MKRPKKPAPVVEDERLIKEVVTKSYEIVRLKRVKYVDNPYVFIDIRFYQKGYNDAGEEVCYPTRKGVQIKEELFVKIFDRYFIDNIEQFLK